MSQLEARSGRSFHQPYFTILRPAGLSMTPQQASSPPNCQLNDQERSDHVLSAHGKCLLKAQRCPPVASLLHPGSWLLHRLPGLALVFALRTIDVELVIAAPVDAINHASVVSASIKSIRQYVVGRGFNWRYIATP